jgi:hypothetical protein
MPFLRAEYRDHLAVFQIVKARVHAQFVAIAAHDAAAAVILLVYDLVLHKNLGISQSEAATRNRPPCRRLDIT